jgi:hypothetical protein
VHTVVFVAQPLEGKWNRLYLDDLEYHANSPLPKRGVRPLYR